MNSNRIDRGNSVRLGTAVVRGTRIHVIGSGNTILFGEFVRAHGARITVVGSNNVLRVGDQAVLDHASLLLEGEGNEISIGANTRVRPRTNLVVNGTAAIRIGSDGGVSTDVEMRAGDSHKLLSLDGELLNPAQDIVIGDHVWIGTRAIFLKGCSVASHSVVGAGSLISKRFDESNVVIAGHPGRVVRRGVTWER